MSNLNSYMDGMHTEKSASQRPLPERLIPAHGIATMSGSSTLKSNVASCFMHTSNSRIEHFSRDKEDQTVRDRMAIRADAYMFDSQSSTAAPITDVMFPAKMFKMNYNLDDVCCGDYEANRICFNLQSKCAARRTSDGTLDGPCKIGFTLGKNKKWLSRIAHL